MVFEAIPLREHHLMCLATRAHTGSADLNGAAARRELLRGEAFAVTDRGEVWGAAGVIPMWSGVGHGWAILAVPTGCRRLIWFTRQVRRYLEGCSFERVQTTVDADFGEGLAWATHLLAFRPEGIMRRYIAGRDHLMMARLRPSTEGNQ